MVALHTAYFLYIHYTTSFHRTVPEPNWFQVPFAVLTTIVLALQAGAFLKTVARQRAEDALIRIQGALVVARATGSNEPFLRVLRDLPAWLVA